jgi:hypothetical protein
VDREVVRIGPPKDTAIAALQALAGSRGKVADARAVQTVSLWTLRLRRLLQRAGFSESALALVSAHVERAMLLMLVLSGSSRRHRRQVVAGDLVPNSERGWRG